MFTKGKEVRGRRPFSFLKKTPLGKKKMWSNTIRRKDEIRKRNQGFSSKGVSQFLAATLLVVVGLVAATMVSNWILTTATERTTTIENRTSSRLACQYASLYVRNVTWDCSNSCFTGVPYKINASIENTGNTRLDIYNMFISLTDGTSYRIDSNGTTINTGAIKTKFFDDILVRSLQGIPNESMDTRRTYGNDSNTVGLWHFDEGSGSEVKDVAQNNTGTLTGATWAAGRFGNALNFDGADDYVDAGNATVLNSPNTTGQITMEAWVYPTVKRAEDTVIIKKDAAYQLVMNGTASLFRCDLWDSVGYNQFIGSALDLNTWQHIACVYDGSNVVQYVNGTIDKITAYSKGIRNNEASILYIGSSDGTNNNFTGRIDELRISNVSRVFNTTLTYDIVRKNIGAVRVYNETGVLINEQTSLGGVATYSNNVTNVTTATDYRVEVEDTSGIKIEKWYPSRGGSTSSACRPRGNLDKITFTSANCPELTDTYYGTDVFFNACVP